ncbi:MAG: tyrosine-protein phosphatase [Ruminococcus sp.]|nr:tyrosine-protein phosphatase [Ruminococcus sp.]
MKNFTKLLPAVCAAALCIPASCGFAAFADDEAQVSVTVEADKESYSKGDSLKFNVSVSNNGESAIDEISLQASLPEIFSITENADYTIDLAANETKTYVISADPVTTSAAATTTAAAATTTAAAAATSAAKASESPKTGVTPPFVSMVIFCAAAVVAVKSKKSRKMFSVMLTLVLLSSVAMPGSADVSAADSETQEVTATAGFQYDGADQTITINATYELIQTAALTVNTDALEEKEDGSFKTTEDFTGLAGTLENPDSIETFTAQVFDFHGELINTADIEPAADWTADELGLEEGYNKVVICAETSDGEKFQEELVIFVPQVLDYSEQLLRDVKGVSNARQLGGYINSQGRKIKQNVLLRTGNLSHITDGSIQALQENYKVSDIMDFRYEREVNDHTIDKDVPGAEHHSVPMSATKEATAKLFSQNPELFAKMQELQRNVNQPGGSTALAIFQAENGILNAQKQAEYFETDEAVEQYREVFNILLNKPEDAAVLFHCAGGKDRTGMVSMLILASLDFDKDIMIQDYLLSNVANADKIAELTAAAEEYTDDPDLRYNIIFNAAVYPEIMETNINDLTEQYGSVKDFLREKVGLTDDDFAKLQELYLED